MRILAAAVAFALLAAAPARAGETPNVLDVSIGVFDLLDKDSAAEGRLEWRGRPMVWWLRPMVGVMSTTDSAAYGYAGLAVELWWFDKRVVLTPSAAAGAYHKGDGKDLGHTLEFRTGAALHYRFDNDARLGIAFHHLSNAGLGKNKKNPGAESLMLTYAWPIGAR
jgi:lipid A 3-O-deacylase